MSARTLITILVALSLSACATTSVRSEHDPDANFSNLNTFAWRNPPARDVEDPILHSAFMDRKVAAAVRDALLRRGFREVPASQADFVVSYHASRNDEVEDSGLSVGFGVGVGSGHHSGTRGHYGINLGDRVRTKPEGTLIIDVMTPRAEHLIWRGWRTTRLTQERFDSGHVARVVDEILAAFPPS